MANLKWPKTVPVMRPEDMCIGPVSEGKCGCLAHWSVKTFYQRAEVDEIAAEARLLEASKALGKAHIQLKTPKARKIRLDVRWAGDVQYETTWSDEGKISESTAARVWNRGMAILGYVVNNPECTKSGKLKPV